MTCHHYDRFAFRRPEVCSICVGAEIERRKEEIKRLQREVRALIQSLGETPADLE